MKEFFGDETLVIVDAPCDVEEKKEPFGERYASHLVELEPEHLEAMKAGKTLAIDVMSEYVVFVKIKGK